MGISYLKDELCYVWENSTGKMNGVPYGNILPERQMVLCMGISYRKDEWCDVWEYLLKVECQEGFSPADCCVLQLLFCCSTDPVTRLWVQMLGRPNMRMEVMMRRRSKLARPISRQLIELFIWGLKYLFLTTQKYFISNQVVTPLITIA